MKWKLNRIGRKVTKFRRAQGWTHGDLVVRLRLMGCGMTLQTLQDIESHRRAVTDAEVVFLSEAFGIPLKDLSD
jgi:transcriptional regulator with XRE-family HTH domain